MNRNGYGGGVLVAQLCAVLILLPLLPLALLAITVVNLRDWWERRVEARAVANA
jgi:hypothetical protein